jgi:hypothetical protein
MRLSLKSGRSLMAPGIWSQISRLGPCYVVSTRFDQPGQKSLLYTMILFKVSEPMLIISSLIAEVVLDIIGCF